MKLGISHGLFPVVSLQISTLIHMGKRIKILDIGNLVGLCDHVHFLHIFLKEQTEASFWLQYQWSLHHYFLPVDWNATSRGKQLTQRIWYVDIVPLCFWSTLWYVKGASQPYLHQQLSNITTSCGWPSFASNNWVWWALILAVDQKVTMCQQWRCCWQALPRYLHRNYCERVSCCHRLCCTNSLIWRH